MISEFGLEMAGDICVVDFDESLRIVLLVSVCSSGSSVCLLSFFLMYTPPFVAASEALTESSCGSRTIVLVVNVLGGDGDKNIGT